MRVERNEGKTFVKLIDLAPGAVFQPAHAESTQIYMVVEDCGIYESDTIPCVNLETGVSFELCRTTEVIGVSGKFVEE